MSEKPIATKAIKGEPYFEWKFEDSNLVISDDAVDNDIVNSAPQRKRKRRTEKPREFKVQWEMELLFARNYNDKPVCLVCGFVVCTNKRFNIERHYRSMHPGMDDKLPLGGGARQQFVFSQKHEMGLIKDLRVDLDPSNVLNMFLSQSKVDFSYDVDFIKNFIDLLTKLVFDESTKNVLKSLCVSSSDTCDKIRLMSSTLHEELKYLAFKSVGFSLVIHKMTNYLGLPYITLLVRTVDEQFDVREEFLSLEAVPISSNPVDHAMTMLNSHEEFDWAKLISVSTNVDTETISEFFTSKGAAKLTLLKSFTFYELCEKLEFQSIATIVFRCLRYLCRLSETPTDYSEMLTNFRQTNIAMSDEAKLCQLQFDTFHIFCEFFSNLKQLKTSVSNVPFLQKETEVLSDTEWVCHLALLTDLTPHMEKFQAELHKKENWFEGLYSATKSFLSKLVLFQRQLTNKSFTHFPNLSTVVASDNDNLVEKLSHYLLQLEQFVQEIFTSLDHDGPYFELICNPFAIDERTIDKLDSKYQLETLEIRNPIYKLAYEDCQRFGKNYLVSFWKKVPQEDYHALRLLAFKFIARFGNTLCVDDVFKIFILLEVSNKITNDEPSLTDMMNISMASIKSKGIEHKSEIPSTS